MKMKTKKHMFTLLLPTTLTLDENEVFDMLTGNAWYSWVNRVERQDGLITITMVDPENTLDEFEREIMKLRFGLDRGEPRTLEEVGKQFNLTRERVRQIEARAISKLGHVSRFEVTKTFSVPDIIEVLKSLPVDQVWAQTLLKDVIEDDVDSESQDLFWQYAMYGDIMFG